MILPVLFDHLEESYFLKNFSSKSFAWPVKTICLPTENVNETPGVKEREISGLFRLLKCCNVTVFAHATIDTVVHASSVFLLSYGSTALSKCFLTGCVLKII